jgi:phage-related protein
MQGVAKRLPARFYRSPAGREPVRDWLRALPLADRKTTWRGCQGVEFSWPIGLPLVRPLGRGLWDVRSSLANGRIARVIFCVDHGEMFLLHGFIKKTQRTPQQDLELAFTRMKGQER